MFRQKTGSVVCASCGSLVGVNDDKCYTCGRRNPGLWGFGPVLRRFGNDLGFVSLVVYGCAALYTATLLVTVLRGGVWSQVRSSRSWARDSGALLMFGASGAVPGLRLGRWWTILSAGWLHGGALHILFNMMWVRQLGPGRGRHLRRRADGDHLHRRGRRWLPVQFVHGRPLCPGSRCCGGGGLTVGASAPIFGSAWRAGLLRPPRRQQHREIRSPATTP